MLTSAGSTTPRALDGAYAKLAWGIKHIQAFQVERDRLLGQLNRPPIVFRQELNTETNEWVVSVAEVAEFPGLSLFVGDGANNFRSALDYLISEIAFIDGGGSTGQRVGVNSPSPAVPNISATTPA